MRFRHATSGVYDYDNDILSVNSANSDGRGRWCVAARRYRYRHHCRLQKVRVQYLTRVLFTHTLFLCLLISEVYNM